MKKWYTSKIMLVNLATTLAGVVAVFQGSEWIMANPQVAAIILVVAGAVNMFLRAMTYKAVN